MLVNLIQDILLYCTINNESLNILPAARGPQFGAVRLHSMAKANTLLMAMLGLFAVPEPLSGAPTPHSAFS